MPGRPASLDPSLPFNDMVAHEFGHVMDWVYAGDRAIDEDDLAARSVQEALADMFAYDYDRDQRTRRSARGPRAEFVATWRTPAAWCSPGRPSPTPRTWTTSTRPRPPTAGGNRSHFNSTILSHAYYLLVQAVGHDRAGNVLQFVPFALSPKPTFGEVARRFIERAQDLYGGVVSAPARAAFAQVGIELPAPEPPEDPDCGPEAC